MAKCHMDLPGPGCKTDPMKYIKIIVALLLAVAVLATSFLDAGAIPLDPLLFPRK